MKHEAVILSWWDTVDSSEWDTHEEVHIKEVIQIGWMVYQDERSIKLADTFSDNEYFGITAIPKGCIHRVSSFSGNVDLVEVF